MTVHSGSPAFLQPPAPFDSYGQAAFVVMSIPYEKTTTYGKGAVNGPAAIIDASSQVEHYDDELRLEAFRSGIATVPPVITDADGENAAAVIERAASHILADGKRFIALGGEHTVSLGLIRAVLAQHPDAGVLHIDAHADLRDEYEGTRFGHGTVMRRVLESHPRIVQVGIRSLSVEEARIIDSEAVTTFFASSIHNDSTWLDRVIDALPQKVYLSFDVDGLDPSIAPGTGTPEPGGLGWYQTLALLRRVAETRTLLSADFVEVAPVDGSHVTEFAVARLIYKLLTYVTAAEGLLSESP